jgi:DNA polymerase-3 subunit delta
LLASEFQDEIKGDRRRHFYLIKGFEPLEMEACVKATIEALPPEVREFNFQSFRLGEDKASDVLDMARASSFFPEPRLLLVRVPPRVKGKLMDTDLLLTWVKNPNTSSTIVLVQAKPLENTKLFKEAKKAGLVVDCRAPSRMELPGWVSRLFTSKGMRITQEGAKVLIERTGEDLEAMVTEAEKLSIYPGPGSPVNPKVIRDMVPLNPSGAAYELSEPMAMGDPGKAARVTLDLLVHNNHFALIAVMETHFLRLLEVVAHLAEAEEEGTQLPSEALADRLGVKPGFVGFLRSQAAKWPLGKIKEALFALEDARRSFVTTSTPPEITLEGLVMTLSLMADGSYIGDARKRGDDT